MYINGFAVFISLETKSNSLATLSLSFLVLQVGNNGINLAGLYNDENNVSEMPGTY